MNCDVNCLSRPDISMSQDLADMLNVLINKTRRQRFCDAIKNTDTFLS